MQLHVTVVDGLMENFRRTPVERDRSPEPIWWLQMYATKPEGASCPSESRGLHLLGTRVLSGWEMQSCVQKAKLTIVSPTGKPSRVEVAQGKVRHATERVASLVLSYSLTSIVRPLRQNLQ